MTTFLQQFRRAFRRTDAPVPAVEHPPASAHASHVRDLTLPIDDPLRPVLQRSSGVVDLDTLHIASPLLDQLRADGVRLLVPLLSQGDLIGMLTLGPRRSEQDYTGDDRTLLLSLALRAAPALRVAQLVHQQRAEARERERIAQELKVARLIQQTLLPRTIPDITGWSITPYYEPAREVGGDFYDFVLLSDGRLGIVIADVTDKGVPAALVMATTRSVLRAAAMRLEAPGAVLARVNDALVPDIPPNMFVTCFYAVLDPVTGWMRFANAGHDIPYWRTAAGDLRELRARGMPLGLMEGMTYEEGTAQLGAGDQMLLYSDGLVEAHNRQRDMFSFERLAGLVGVPAESGQALIERLLGELQQFTGPDWIQEDDITLVAIQCTALTEALERPTVDGWVHLAHLEIPSAPDNERAAMDQVASAIAPLGLSAPRLERLKTAVAEATMNAMEHGNQFRADQPTRIQVRRSADALSVRIFDHGVGPTDEPVMPDLLAKLNGEQTPRGWGLYLIRQMVDELYIGQEDDQHVIELLVKL